MKKKFAAALAAALLSMFALMVCGAATGALPFEDVQPNGWFYTPVVWVGEKCVYRKGVKGIIPCAISTQTASYLHLIPQLIRL